MFNERLKFTYGSDCQELPYPPSIKFFPNYLLIKESPEFPNLSSPHLFLDVEDQLILDHDES